MPATSVFRLPAISTRNLEVLSPLFPNQLVYAVSLLQEALTEKKKSIKQFSELLFANYTCLESEFS
jgi:hypothetical protein